jgi:hypothetical protein
LEYPRPKCRTFLFIRCAFVILTFTFRSTAVDISDKSVVSALQDYAKSAEIAQVHNDIRTFCRSIPSSRLGDKDYILDETTRLIEKHRVQVPRA